jgi:restriction endonuclease S subunit
MTIIGGRIKEIEGKHVVGKELKGLAVSIGIDDVRINNDGIEIDYVYNATYEGDVGYIKIKGSILAKESDELTQEIKSEWEKSKKLPADYLTNLLNIITRGGTSNGVLLARVLDLPPPLPPLQIVRAGKK